MLFRSRPKKVFYYGKPVDFRKQAFGLAAIVDLELPGEMRAGNWFVFVSTDKKKAKILYWRGTGVALWQLRLERDLFQVECRISLHLTPLISPELTPLVSRGLTPLISGVI